jgi:N-acetylmuramoyl-L-alanine amidase
VILNQKFSLTTLLLLLFFLTGCTRSSDWDDTFVFPDENLQIEEKPFIPQNNAKGQTSEKNTLVILDAGHGGEDFGAHSTTKPKYHEKNLNLVLTHMVKSFLNQEGFKTQMTRYDDTFISLENRAKFANSFLNCIFVSLHFNSAPSKDADGIEVYYYKSSINKERTESSRALAKAVLDSLVKKNQVKSRGIKDGDFAVIRKTTMPAILIEAGFMTNEAEMEKIKDPHYLKQLAWGITLGIQDYLSF